jgi:two-component sensor histidine kinase
LHDFSPEQPHIYNITTIKTPNGNVKVLESYIEAEFDDNGDLFEHVAFIREITDSVMRQREVERLSEERKILLQEVHHRVKNNLQLINSFLSLDSRYYNDDPKYVIDKAQNRLDAMAITHEEIYQSDDMAHINLKSLIHSEISSLFRKFKINNIKQNYFLKEVFVDTDKAISLSLLINELAFNCIKHAFPDGSKGNFSINLNVVDGEVILRVWDDGVGLPDDMDFYNNSSLGFLIIQRLTVQLEAEIHIIEDIPGFGVKIIMPL